MHTLRSLFGLFIFFFYIQVFGFFKFDKGLDLIQDLPSQCFNESGFDNSEKPLACEDWLLLQEELCEDSDLIIRTGGELSGGGQKRRKKEHKYKKDSHEQDDDGEIETVSFEKMTECLHYYDI